MLNAKGNCFIHILTDPALSNWERPKIGKTVQYGLQRSPFSCPVLDLEQGYLASAVMQ